MTLSLEQRIANLSPEKRALLEKRLQDDAQQLVQRNNSIPSRPANKPLPLSFSQQRLWFLDQLDPSKTNFHATAVWKLTGELNPDLLQQSLDEIVRRHESIRTTYQLKDGIPAQIINPPVPFPLRLVDLTQLAPEAHDDEVQRLALADNRLAFDLGKDVMRRALLLRFSNQTHVLLFTHHHIASDGWSTNLFWRELSAIYTAYVQGSPSPLPKLPIQYADYACWQRENLRGEKLENLLRYWQRQLADAPASLNLPFDFPRPIEQKGIGKIYRFSLTQATTQALLNFSKKANVTLYMTLLAAFQLLLMRYSNQQDIVVGTSIANRQRPEIEGLIGMFVNTLVLRTNLAGNPTFLELLQRVREVTLAAFTHQDLPFERLVEALQPQRTLNQHPLFQVVLSLQNTPKSTLALAGVETERIDIDCETAKYDLALSFAETATGLAGRIEYNSALFAPATIERMASHFATLITSIIEQPDGTIEQLSLLPSVERTQLLYEWNHTQRAYPSTKTLHQLFEEQVARTPDAIALVASDASLSYRELNQQANRLAHRLRRLGVTAEVPVALCLDRTSALVVGLLAILKAGGAYVPIDPGYPTERIRLLLDDIAAPLLLTNAAIAEQLADYPIHTLLLDENSPWQSDNCQHNLDESAQPTNLAYILYTSGSTGKPKGVMIEHRQVVNYVLAILEECVPPQSSCAMLQPLTVDSSLTMLYPPLFSGGTLHLLRHETALDAHALHHYFQQHAIDCLKIAPSHLAALQADSEAGLLLPRKSLIIGGESSRWAWVEELQRLSDSCQVFNHYGPTETTVGVLTYRMRSATDSNAPVATPLGRPLANSEMYVLDRHVQPQPIGVVGELYIGGATVGRGYLNRPELTGERFLPNPFGKGRLYRTGDLVRYLADGNLEFLGRSDQQVKIRGFRIELGEIEAALTAHPSVTAAVVAMQTQQSAEPILVAYVVLSDTRNSATSNSDARNTASRQRVATLQDYLRHKLPHYMCPAAILLLDELPRTPHGKLDRSRLPRYQATADATPIQTQPRNEIEATLSTIWAEFLKVPQGISIFDNFFTLGGHSLLAVRLINRIRIVFQIELALKSLFLAPTIAELAQEIEHIQLIQKLQTTKQTAANQVAANQAAVNQVGEDEYEEVIL